MGLSSNLANYGDVIFLQAKTQAFDGQTYTHPAASAGVTLDMTGDGAIVLSRGSIIDDSTVKCDYAGQ